MMTLPYVGNISFAHPYLLVLLLLIPFLLWWRRRRSISQQPAIRLTTLTAIKQVSRSWRVKFRPVLTVLRMTALAALVIALARPQSTSVNEFIDSEGIDIVLSIDVSGSMLAEDLQPNRIEAAKQVALDFVEQRPTDRIGLVIFSGESFTLCPITIDHHVVQEQIANIKSGMLVDGTAIGMGLATGVDRLRATPGKSRVLVLLTDGVNNAGHIDPVKALEIAKAYNVRVYTIGVGTRVAPRGTQQSYGIDQEMIAVQIDEALLQRIAKETGGKYFRATDNRSLAAIYTEINKLEKTRIDISTYKQYAELFFPFAFLAGICVWVELLLRYTVFRRST